MCMHARTGAFDAKLELWHKRRNVPRRGHFEFGASNLALKRNVGFGKQISGSGWQTCTRDLLQGFDAFRHRSNANLEEFYNVL
jgi:hypothetical protein